MKELKKEEIENLSYKDITNIILQNEKKGLNTLELFTTIVDTLQLNKSVIETKIGDYYTSLTTDKRFILIDGVWDLRSRHTSDKILVDSIEIEEETDFDEVKDDDLTVEDTYDDEYIDDMDIDNDFDDGDDDSLSELVVLDEDELN